MFFCFSYCLYKEQSIAKGITSSLKQYSVSFMAMFLTLNRLLNMQEMLTLKIIAEQSLQQFTAIGEIKSSGPWKVNSEP